MSTEITFAEKAKVWMQIVLTVITFAVALYFLFAGGDGAAIDKKFAAGWIGVILGYWFS